MTAETDTFDSSESEAEPWGTYDRAMWAIECWREQAAARVAEFVAMGGMTMKPARAAALMGVDERTIYRWKRRAREPGRKPPP
jgi:hypothetical protein